MERLWAGWRLPYVSAASEDARSSMNLRDDAGSSCVFCSILESNEPDSTTYVVWRGQLCFVVLNAFPYTSGHLLVMPNRHVSELEGLNEGESAELWATMSVAVRVLKMVYSPDGLNIGSNLGRAAGAGIPGHFHMHVLPRWSADTNFITSVAEARVMPEALGDTWARLRNSWPVS